MPRILYICHGHPKLVPGGTETVAHDLFRAMGDVPGCQAMFLGCVSPLHRPSRPGTRFQAIGRSADEMLSGWARSIASCSATPRRGRSWRQ